MTAEALAFQRRAGPRRGASADGRAASGRCKEVEFPFHVRAGLRRCHGAFARGAFGQGDVMAWMRIAPTAARRHRATHVTAADSGNGVSLSRFTFVNPDLTVTLHRPAEGAWIGMAARTDFDDRRRRCSADALTLR